MLSDHCPVCLSVCDIGVLTPNGWMDQNAMGNQLPLFQKGQQPHPQFSDHVCCGQMAGWIKMPLGREVDLGPGDVVLDGDPAPLKRCTAPIFQPMSIVAKQLGGSRCYLVVRR